MAASNVSISFFINQKRAPGKPNNPAPPTNHQREVELPDVIEGAFQIQQQLALGFHVHAAQAISPRLNIC